MNSRTNSGVELDSQTEEILQQLISTVQDPTAFLSHVAASNAPQDLDLTQANEAILQGYLKKERASSQGGSSWRRYWFVLRRDALYYYRKGPEVHHEDTVNPDAEPSGKIDLLDIRGFFPEAPTLDSSADAPSFIPNAFCLTYGSSARLVTLQAPLDGLRLQWLTALGACIVWNLRQRAKSLAQSSRKSTSSSEAIRSAKKLTGSGAVHQSRVAQAANDEVHTVVSEGTEDLQDKDETLGSTLLFENDSVIAEAEALLSQMSAASQGSPTARGHSKGQAKGNAGAASSASKPKGVPANLSPDLLQSVVQAVMAATQLQKQEKRKKRSKDSEKQEKQRGRDTAQLEESRVQASRPAPTREATTNRPRSPLARATSPLVSPPVSPTASVPSAAASPIFNPVPSSTSSPMMQGADSASKFSVSPLQMDRDGANTYLDDETEYGGYPDASDDVVNVILQRKRSQSIQRQSSPRRGNSVSSYPTPGYSMTRGMSSHSLLSTTSTSTLPYRNAGLGNTLSAALRPAGSKYKLLYIIEWINSLKLPLPQSLLHSSQQAKDYVHHIPVDVKALTDENVVYGLDAKRKLPSPNGLLHQHLESGVLLCSLMEYLKPEVIPIVGLTVKPVSRASKLRNVEKAVQLMYQSGTKMKHRISPLDFVDVPTEGKFSLLLQSIVDSLVFPPLMKQETYHPCILWTADLLKTLGLPLKFPLSDIDTHMSGRYSTHTPGTFSLPQLPCSPWKGLWSLFSTGYIQAAILANYAPVKTGSNNSAQFQLEHLYRSPLTQEQKTHNVTYTHSFLAELQAPLFLTPVLLSSPGTRDYFEPYLNDKDQYSDAPGEDDLFALLQLHMLYTRFHNQPITAPPSPLTLSHTYSTLSLVQRAVLRAKGPNSAPHYALPCPPSGVYAPSPGPKSPTGSPSSPATSAVATGSVTALPYLLRALPTATTPYVLVGFNWMDRHPWDVPILCKEQALAGVNVYDVKLGLQLLGNNNDTNAAMQQSPRPSASRAQSPTGSPLVGATNPRATASHAPRPMSPAPGSPHAPHAAHAPSAPDLPLLLPYPPAHPLHNLFVMCLRSRNSVYRLAEERYVEAYSAPEVSHAMRQKVFHTLWTWANNKVTGEINAMGIAWPAQTTIEEKKEFLQLLAKQRPISRILPDETASLDLPELPLPTGAKSPHSSGSNAAAAGSRPGSPAQLVFSSPRAAAGTHSAVPSPAANPKANGGKIASPSSEVNSTALVLSGASAKDPSTALVPSGDIASDPKITIAMLERKKFHAEEEATRTRYYAKGSLRRQVSVYDRNAPLADSDSASTSAPAGKLLDNKGGPIRYTSFPPPNRLAPTPRARSRSPNFVTASSWNSHNNNNNNNNSNSSSTTVGIYDNHINTSLSTAAFQPPPTLTIPGTPTSTALAELAPFNDKRLAYVPLDTVIRTAHSQLSAKASPNFALALPTSPTAAAGGATGGSFGAAPGADPAAHFSLPDALVKDRFLRVRTKSGIRTLVVRITQRQVPGVPVGIKDWEIQWGSCRPKNSVFFKSNATDVVPRKLLEDEEITSRTPVILDRLEGILRFTDILPNAISTFGGFVGEKSGKVYITIPADRISGGRVYADVPVEDGIDFGGREEKYENVVQLTRGKAAQLDQTEFPPYALNAYRKDPPKYYSTGLPPAKPVGMSSPENINAGISIRLNRHNHKAVKSCGGFFVMQFLSIDSSHESVTDMIEFSDALAKFILQWQKIVNPVVTEVPTEAEKEEEYAEYYW